MSAGRTAARENRAFLGRAVRYLAAETGIRQFIDIGTGLPAAGNVHADLRDPADILDSPVTRDVIDFTQPVALLLTAVLHYLQERQ